MSETVIVYAKRTPIGKLSGSLSNFSAPQLSAPLISDALSSLDLDPQSVDEIILGNVLTAGVGQAPARQAAIHGGLSLHTPATTIGKVCGSGLKAVILADQAIRLGDSAVVFCGGQESMSQAPHLLMAARQGYRFGHVQTLDSMLHDGLWDPYNNVAMGNCGDLCARDFELSREAQDTYARQSYERARQAVETGAFDAEILSLSREERKGTVTIDKDEEPFSVDLEKLSKLRPAFDKDGTVTAGNASSINDGASLLVAMSAAKAKELGLKPLVRIVAQACYAHEPQYFTTAPIGCIEKLLAKAQLSAADIDHYEINEAFAVVAMAAIKKLGLNPDKVNPYGGAVALGHPIGASGARILTTLVHGLQRQKQKYGLATLCIGGGEAAGVIVECIGA